MPTDTGKPYRDFFYWRDLFVARDIDSATLPAITKTVELLTLELASAVRDYLLGRDYEVALAPAVRVRRLLHRPR